MVPNISKRANPRARSAAKMFELPGVNTDDPQIKFGQHRQGVPLQRADAPL